MKFINCIVACANSNGNPELIRTTVSCTQETINSGEHYTKAKAQVEQLGYTDPVWVADETDPGFFARPSTKEFFLSEAEREKISAANPGHTLIGMVEDIAVVEENKPSFAHAPFTAVLKNPKTGEWKRISIYLKSPERAFLQGLAQKYGSPMSQFETYAARMLGLPEPD